MGKKIRRAVSLFFALVMLITLCTQTQLFNIEAADTYDVVSADSETLIKETTTIDLVQENESKLVEDVDIQLKRDEAASANNAPESRVINTTTDIKIEGFQMSASFKGVEGSMGFRTIYSAEPLVNGSTATEIGVIFGLQYGDNNITEADMYVGSANKYVTSFAATAAGIISQQMGDSATATYYARTMDVNNYIKEGYSAQYYIRPYAKLEDGSYVYGTMAPFTIFNVSEILYEKKSMPTLEAHNNLYNKILNVVNVDYKEVDYNWSSSIVRP